MNPLTGLYPESVGYQNAVIQCKDNLDEGGLLLGVDIWNSGGLYGATW